MYNEDDANFPFDQHEDSFLEDLSSDDEMDWEEVNVSEGASQLQVHDATNVPSTSQIIQGRPSEPLEITLDDQENAPKTPKKRVMSHAERVLRLQVHKIHTICLISNGRIRNRYLNDDLLHARLISLIPLQLQLAFSTIHKKREPDVRQRGRMFEAAVKRLAEWWHKTFFKADPPGSGEIQNRTFDEVQLELNRRIKEPKLEESESEEEEGEIIRSCKSLQKHALLQAGSRDVSAQLFTALCRALDIPARLVVSIQSVPWKASLGKDPITTVPMQSPQPQVDRKGKGKAVFPGVGQTLSGQPAQPQGKAPFIRLRAQRPRGKTLQQSQRTQVLASIPPTQWIEVFSRADGRWLPVDPIRGSVDKKTTFEPQKNDKRNRMVYVLAFEEDGYVRDVTRRYAREFNQKTSKLRLGGRGKKEWWDIVVSSLTRPYRLHRDDLEDAELQSQQIFEGMPTSVVAFKDHPLYILERHVLRDQVIHPRIEIGRFRGEPVFSRDNLLTGLKTSENWMRSGRVVQEGEQPLKSAKVRPVTINRKRALELADHAASTSLSEDSGGVTQGLYAEFQTKLYIPPPVTDGKVPKNEFGNIDLYVDTMLPSGAVHVPFKGAVKVAKGLDFDYAEAVTGFEFRNRRAFPILTGIVIAAEVESAFLEAYWEVMKDAKEKERIKEEKRLLKQWAKLINGLRVKKRLQEQYAPSDGNAHAHEADSKEVTDGNEPGGFLVEMADNVVQAYTLPKQSYPTAQVNDSIPMDEGESQNQFFDVYSELAVDEDNTTSETLLPIEIEQSMQPTATVVPKTLQEIAEANPEIFKPVEELDIQPTTPAKSRAQTSKKSLRKPKLKTPRTADKVSAKATPGGRKRRRSNSSSSEAQGSDEDRDVSVEAPHSRRRKASGIPAVAVPSPSTRILRPRKVKHEDVLLQ